MRKSRKIGFYYLLLNTLDYNVQDIFSQVITLIEAKNLQERNLQFGDNKFGFLASVNTNNDSTKRQVTFKSATHSFRPPLLHRTTTEERENPKLLPEGDRIKTHGIAKFVNGEIVFVLEQFQSGLSMNQIIKYLNSYIDECELESRIKFEAHPVGADNFLEQIEALNRTVSADVYVDKNILGSDALNFSNRITEVQHSIVVGIKAQRQKNIKSTVTDLFTSMNNGSSEITRIRVVGRNNENNIVHINTEFIERKEYVDVTINEHTGELDSVDLLLELETVIRNF